MDHINLLAVLVAAIAAMVVGSVWYSNAMFAKQWMHAIGKNPHDQAEMERMKKGAKPAMISMFIGALLLAFVMSMFVGRYGHSAGTGMQVAFWAWLGFALPAKVGDVMFGGRNKKLIWIDGGYQLVNYLIIGAIVGAWK